MLGIADLSGIASSNSAQGSTSQRSFSMDVSSIAPDKTWSLATADKTVYLFGGVDIPAGATLTASGAEIHLGGTQLVAGTLTVSGSKLIDHGVRALSGATATITGSEIGGSFESNPGCLTPLPNATVTGNRFVNGGSITNCPWDVPGGKKVTGTGNTGVGSYSSHNHICVWPLPEEPVVHTPYPRRIWDVAWEMPDDPPCTAGYVERAHT